MIRTLDRALDDAAAAERTALVDADVAEAVDLAPLIAKQHEILAERMNTDGFRGDFFGQRQDVPVIDQHDDSWYRCGIDSMIS